MFVVEKLCNDIKYNIVGEYISNNKLQWRENPKFHKYSSHISPNRAPIQYQRLPGSMFRLDSRPVPIRASSVTILAILRVSYMPEREKHRAV